MRRARGFFHARHRRGATFAWDDGRPLVLLEAIRRMRQLEDPVGSGTPSTLPLASFSSLFHVAWCVHVRFHVVEGLQRCDPFHWFRRMPTKTSVQFRNRPGWSSNETPMEPPIDGKTGRTGKHASCPPSPPPTEAAAVWKEDGVVPMDGRWSSESAIANIKQRGEKGATQLYLSPVAQDGKQIEVDRPGVCQGYLSMTGNRRTSKEGGIATC